MSFTVSKQCSVVKNYPELGIVSPSDSEMVTTTYEAIMVNSVAAGVAEVQFSVKADGIGEGIITYSFPHEGLDNLLGQAEMALQNTLANQ
ncbi:TPA: hypothetical protein NPN65_004600 [Klebsiella quasipneumoniae subsp. similipneumoniae]|uniref:hypothetical protein n=1 Tax=Klebsiella pneumoniae TaxID=573 RepID=UPI00115B5F96|nr:hypothetical protein [Klebsiella pneumoniae]HCI5911696.1 hypothetical protein [Klebsiella quasipneumoniae subsp. similipneumoniae]